MDQWEEDQGRIEANAVLYVERREFCKGERYCMSDEMGTRLEVLFAILTQFIVSEMEIWSQLRHWNVVEFMGYRMDNSNFLTLISEWMENGTAFQYVVGNPQTDVYPLVRKPLSTLHHHAILKGGKRCSGLRKASITSTIRALYTRILNQWVLYTEIRHNSWSYSFLGQCVHLCNWNTSNQ